MDTLKYTPSEARKFKIPQRATQFAGAISIASLALLGCGEVDSNRPVRENLYTPTKYFQEANPVFSVADGTCHIPFYKKGIAIVEGEAFPKGCQRYSVDNRLYKHWFRLKMAIKSLVY